MVAGERGEPSQGRPQILPTFAHLVESYKEESKFRSNTTPLAVLATGIVLRVSYGSDVSEYIQ